RGALAGAVVVAHHAAFDLQFLARLGVHPRKAHCTQVLSQLLHGPRKGAGFHSLQNVAARELRLAVSKAEQSSDWSAAALTPGQLAYAAADAAVLPPLWAQLRERVAGTGQGRAAEIESRCLPALAWLARSGVGFDKAAWDALAAEAEGEAEGLA